MQSANGELSVTFNGEIFNYIELRQAMIRRGHRFRTDSDTEVILKLYQERGGNCVTELNGDFAFAIWDKRQQRLMLARDRMGVRPLYYARRPDGLFFASEVKALLMVPGVRAELDPFALDQIFTFWFPLCPRTPFKGIFELPPAHVLVAESASISIRRYWQMHFADEMMDRRSEAAIAAELRELLTDATRIRLRSDVPVGAYLSGGLDSSIIAAVTRQIKQDKLRTFSVTFDAAEYDESAFQGEMADALGTEHVSVACRTDDIGKIFPDVIRTTERPILRTAPAPLFHLSGLVRAQGYKVVLTGEGADEVFAGYDIMKEAKIRRFCASQPQSRRRPLLLQRLYPYLPGLKGQSQKYLEAFFRARAEEVGDPLFSHLPRFRNTAGAKVFFSDELRRELGNYDALDELRAGLPPEFSDWHPLAQSQYLETAYLLPGYILSSQGDRVAMAHAVEGRFPFLDPRVVEFAARIPPRLKMKGLREKHILREAMGHLLPPAIGNRPKQPYRAPDAHSFVGANAQEYVKSIMSEHALANAGAFNPRAVAKLQQKCVAAANLGFRDNVAFVGILSTQLWHDAFVEQNLSHQNLNAA
ncbi:asparagine synthase [Bradyrhizobium sp. Leaf396]|jgi:asparagine synthase (glutamine-hydrolysing)|nr:asparagine synthase [Bradyrhizobium sp. Leaf396]